MTYEEICSLTTKRNLNNIKPSLSTKEAEDYYGLECCELLKKIFEYCKKNNYIIYQHATNVESAKNILKKGYVVSTEKTTYIPKHILFSTPAYSEVDEDDGVKTVYYDGEPIPRDDEYTNGDFDALSNRQHFFENGPCQLDFGGLTNANVSRNSEGIGATLLFCVPRGIGGFREFNQYGIRRAYYDDDGDREIPETHFKRKVIPRQFCIGYLDVKGKRFVVNPDFQFNYGIQDEFEKSFIPNPSEYQDLSTALNKHRR